MLSHPPPTPGSGEKNRLIVPRLQVREIGIPVRGVNWVQLFAGRTASGESCLYATMGQESAPLFVLQIDPRNGTLRQFDASPATANFCPAVCMAPDGRLYLGAAYAGRLLCFDPEQDALVDLGLIHPEAATFPCRIDVAPDGGVWIGSYPTADLTRYDPATREFARFGRMDDVDMYNYPLVNTDGSVANLIRMTRSFVVVLDPESGVRRPVGPVAVQGDDTLDLWRGVDGQLYIESSLGNFMLHGFEVMPVEELPSRQGAAALPDGTTFDFADAAEQSFRQLRLQTPGGSTQLFELDYLASGSRIFTIHTGPDDRVYGSSLMPLHLFRWDPATDDLTDLGRCSSATGEAYSMANLDGRMYISSYPGAVLSVYDPTRPFHFGVEESDNPRDLGRIDELSYRPRSTLTGPLGRVWTASIPDYGRWSGPLSWYDPRSGERHAYHGVAGDGSCYTLAWLRQQKLIAVGLSIEAGSGAQPKLESAGLFLWDYEAQTKVWEGALPGAADVISVNSLVVGADGALYGTARRARDLSELFRFEPNARVFTDCLPLPESALDHGLQPTPDGNTLYGFTLGCIYRVRPERHGGEFGFAEILRDDEAGFRTAGPVCRTPGGEVEILFARTHKLMAARLHD